MVIDNRRREQRGERPVFDNRGPLWGLVAWDIAEGILERERQIQTLLLEIDRETRLALANELSELSPKSIEPLLLTLLEQMDYSNIKVSKRTSDDDVFLSADWATGLAHRRICIQLIGSTNRTLEAEDVSNLRSILTHYSADEGIIVHVGPISREIHRL